MITATVTRMRLKKKLTRATQDVSARREPQRGPEEHSRGPLWGENFGIFLFKMAHFGVLYISERRRGSQTSRGPG